jgi:ABC-type nickel/cobalt efflux system permease component RcnA
MQPIKNNNERTLSSLFSELTREMTSLLRHEVALARAEVNEKVSTASSGLIFLAAGALVAFAGMLVLLAALVIGLSYVWPPWVAALVVGLFVTIIGVALLLHGRTNLKATNLKPQRTTQSLRHDRQLVREHVR